MRVLVTGGAGFIGSHVVERLLCGGHAVTVVDDLSRGHEAAVPPGASLLRLSILDPKLAAAAGPVDAVVHAAAQTSVAQSNADPADDALANIVGTLRVLEAGARAGARRLLFLSSAAVYGRMERLPIPEGNPIAPSSPYGLSKWVGEQYLRLVGPLAGVEWVVLRLANVYGPRQSAAGEAGVVARWTAALGAGQPIELHGSGGQTRDFVYVTDVAEAVARGLETPGAAGQTLNIGTGTGVAIRDLLTTLERLTGRPATVLHTPERTGDVEHSALDASAAGRILGWSPRVTLDHGLGQTLAWLKGEPPGVRSAP